MEKAFLRVYAETGLLEALKSSLQRSVARLLVWAMDENVIVRVQSSWDICDDIRYGSLENFCGGTDPKKETLVSEEAKWRGKCWDDARSLIEFKLVISMVQVDF